MTSYGQFCPVAKAMELLDERWTMLVVRELLAGSTHFNDLRRGNPRMSPALLSKRLRTLERAGVITRRVDGGRSSYHLTPSGEELHPAVTALATWGTRWIGELGDEDLDPHLLLWDIQRTITTESWPQGRTVVRFDFADSADSAAHVARWWLCVNGTDVDVCDFDPGFDVDLTLGAELRTMVEVWRGDRSWDDALRRELLTISGAEALTSGVPRLLGQMTTAGIARPG